MAFLSGSFGERNYPAVLDAIANVLPLAHFIDLVRAAALESAWPWSDPGSLAIVTAWGAAGYALAARRFSWEPRER
jgi:ABC-type polysaccharide/polyol phosphate export permease